MGTGVDAAPPTSNATQAPAHAVRRVRGVERSAFLYQLALVAAMLCVAVAMVVADPRVLDAPTFVAGYAVVGVLTAATVLIRWERLPKTALMVVPLGDILGIALTALHGNTVAFSLLYMLPVIWLATHFTMLGVAIGVLLPTGLQIARVATTPSEPGMAVTRIVAVPIVLGLVAVTIHVSRRRDRAQRALLRRQASALRSAVAHSRRSADELDATLDAMGVGVITLDTDGRPILTNRAYRDMVERVDGAAGDMTFRNVYASNGFATLTGADRPIPRAVRDGALEETVVWVGEPGATRLALAVSARPTFDVDGRPDGVAVMARDVTAERLAVQARDDLVAAVSHELRTPLTAVIGYLDLVLDNDMDASIRSMLSIAGSNAERLMALIDDFRAAAAGIDNITHLTRRQSSVRGIVEDSITSFRPAAALRDVTVELAADPVVTAWVDEFRLRHVIDNLMSNAIKYCRAGGHVRVSARQGEDETTVAVSNDNEGLGAEELARVFDRFYRSDRARRSGVHGAGLGLSISSDIVARHGGRITASSVPGRSVTLTVRLPRRESGDH